VDPSLKLGQYLIKDENLSLTIKALHNFYEFHRIPESWFEEPRIPLPEDIETINQTLKNKGVYVQVSIEDNDLFISRITELRKIFAFARLPEELITRKSLPEPEFDLAPLFC
jgi:uncharacterized protein YcgL (UPF0745 family)